MIQSGDIGSWIENIETSLVVKVTVGMDGRGEEKEYKQRSQVSISTTHSFSVTYFISDITELPNAKNDCVDCYRDENHRICSFQNDIEERKKTCDIDISKVKLPKNYQITGSKLFTESKIGSVHLSRPLLVVLARKKTESVRHIVKSYVEGQLESLTHYSRIEVDNNYIMPSIPSARYKVILRSLLK